MREKYSPVMIRDGTYYTEDQRPTVRQRLASAVKNLKNAFQLSLAYVAVTNG